MSDAALETQTARLVALARAGDLHAFGALVDLHARAARRVAAAALATPADADDVVQEACLTAWQKLSELSDANAFRGWLLRIAWRKAIDRRRSTSSWLRRFTSNEHADPQMGLVRDLGPDPEVQAIGTELDAAIAVAIRSLPTRLRDPFLLATAQRQRYGDIADVLGLPVGTVKWRVFEARRILRAKLKGLGHEAGDV
jgi:RNA polymerase sigma-70 factor (ECF subfamily)